MAKYLIVSDCGTKFHESKLEYALDTAHEYVYAMGGIAEVFEVHGRNREKIAIFIGKQSVGMHLPTAGVECVYVEEYDAELDEDEEYVNEWFNKWNKQLEQLMKKLG